MPTGQPAFITDGHSTTANITPVGQLKTNEVFDILKPSYHESMTAASGGTRLADMQVGKLYVQSLSGNAVMYVGGQDTDAPFSGRGILLKSDDINPIPLELPISNANKVSICATVSGQLVSYWGFINSANVVLDPARQGTAPDTEPPTLLSSIPYSGAGNIGISGTTLYAYFNEALASGSVNTSSFILRNSGVAESTMVSGTVALFTNIAAFQPNSGQLAYGSFYSMYFTPLITDVAGNHMLNSGSFTFATQGAPDTSGPIFLSSDPVDQETNVVTNNQIVNAYYNEFLDSNSITTSSFVVKLSGGSKVSGSASLAFDQKTAALQIFSGQLGFTSWYNAYVTPGITDTAGNPTVTGTFAFQTAAAPDTSGPVYLSSDPLSGTTGISANGVTFLAYFNESLLGSSIDQSSFIMRLSGASVATMVSGTAQVSPGNPKVAQFAPSSGQLAASSWYNSFLTLRITDLNANTMPVSGKFSFLTVGIDTSGPIYLSSDPVSGATGISTNAITFYAYFNEALLGSSITQSSMIMRFSGAAEATMVSGLAQINGANNKVAQFAPNSGQLTASAYYNVFLTPLVKDLVGNTMPVSGKFNFLTAGVVQNPPVVVSTVPASGSANFNISNDMTVTMDKTCSGTTSTMAPVVSVIDISGTVFNGTTTFDSVGGKVFTFNPSSDLRYSLPANIRISGIKDTFGNFMVPVNVPFTSADPALNNVYSVSPTISTHQLDGTYYIMGEKRDNSSSQLDGLQIRQVKVYLKRTGTPNTVVKVVIRQDIEGSDTNHVTIGQIQSTSLTTSFAQYTFTNLSNSYTLTTNDLVGVWADNAALRVQTP